MGRGPHVAGAISRYQGGRRPRNVAGDGLPDRSHPYSVQDRQRDLSVRKGQVGSRPNILPTIGIGIPARRGRFDRAASVLGSGVGRRNPPATPQGWTIAPSAVIIANQTKQGSSGGFHMMTYLKSRTCAWLAGATVALVACAMFLVSGHAQTKEPIKIGFGMALTGPLSPNGKMSLVAMQVWEDDINAKGGLLGRPVKLVYYDDQSNPSQVPGIYTKLLEIDKVDLIVSGYASGQIAPAMPIAIQKNKLFISLFGTGINETFKYSKYFSMIPNGPTPKPAFTRGFFKVAEVQKPKPQTIALASADAEFGHNACEGARENAKTSGFKVVYDKS